MASIEKKNFNSPDTVTQVGKGEIKAVKVSGVVLELRTLEPGWKWSEHIQPKVKTKSCEERHIKYIISGKERMLMDDGTKMDIGPGDFVVIEPGHDSWVLGDEPCVLLEMATIEKPAEK